MDHKELAENHKCIWLAPRCEVDERTWCEDDQGCCDNCSEEWVEYVRADLAKAEIERLQAALNHEQKAGEKCPWCKTVHTGSCGRLISGGQSD